MNILAARSDVFRAIIVNNMMERRTKRVDMQDVNPKVVSEMLNFIYTGIRITNEDVLKEKAAELLGAANRYQLELLKSICEDKLYSSLNISNSINYLIFGDMYKASKLRRIALRMVTSNMATLIGTKEYKDLVKNNPVLVLEIPGAMVEVMTNN